MDKTLITEPMLTNKKKRVSLKQRKWVRALIRTGNPTEASRQAYDVKDNATASRIAYENVRKLNWSFVELMETMGITDESDVNLLEQLRDAKKQIVIDKSLVDVRDNDTRLRALELTMKLKGRMRENGNGNGGTYTQIIIEAPESVFAKAKEVETNGSKEISLD